MTESEWLAGEDPRAMLEFLFRGTTRYRTGMTTLISHKLRSWVEAMRHAYYPTRTEPWGYNLSVPEDLTKAVAEWMHSDCDSLVSASSPVAFLHDIFGNPFHPVVLDPAHVTRQSLDLAQAAYEVRGDDGTLDPFRLSLVADALEEAGCTDAPGRTESATIYVQNHGEGWYVMIGVSSGANIVHRAASRKAAICHAEKVYRVKHWQTKQSVRPPTESPCWGSGLVDIPGQPHPVLAHLRSPGPHVRGCWALDLVLGKE